MTIATSSPRAAASSSCLGMDVVISQTESMHEEEVKLDDVGEGVKASMVSSSRERSETVSLSFVAPPKSKLMLLNTNLLGQSMMARAAAASSPSSAGSLLLRKCASSACLAPVSPAGAGGGGGGSFAGYAGDKMTMIRSSSSPSIAGELVGHHHHQVGLDQVF